MSNGMDRKIEIAVAAEVEKQLSLERSILKDAGGIALKIIAGSFVLLFAIFTIFGLTTWRDVKKETSDFIKSRADELVQRADSESGVKQTLNDLVNRAIVSSVLLTLKRDNAAEFELPKNEWDRLRAWVKIENLSVEDFTDALAIFNSQKSERKKSDANGFLSEMLNPPDGSPYQWMKKQPDKRLAIMTAFEHPDMGAAALEVALSSSASGEARVAAITYLRKVRYAEGFEKILKLASSSEDEELKKEALITGSVLRPTDKRLSTEIDKLVSLPNPRSSAIQTAVDMVREVWRSKYSDSEAEDERVKPGKRLLSFAFDHGAYLSEDSEPRFVPGAVGEATRIVLWIPSGSGATGRTVSAEQLRGLKPYWELLDDAANLNDVSKVHRLMVRYPRFRELGFTIRVKVPKDASLIVDDGAGNRKTLAADALNDTLVVGVGGTKRLLLSTSKGTISGELVGFSGKGFKFSGQQTSRASID